MSPAEQMQAIQCAVGGGLVAFGAGCGLVWIWIEERRRRALYK